MTATIAMPESRTEPAAATRVAVARFVERRRAEEAVERITGNRVPERAVDLTASGVRPAAPPTKRFNYWNAAIEGMRVGAIFGALFAGVWAAAGLSDGSAGVVGLMLGALIGAMFGAVVAMAGHWGERDPMRAEGLLHADEFHILVEARYEDDAREALRPAEREGSARNGTGRFSRSRTA